MYFLERFYCTAPPGHKNHLLSFNRINFVQRDRCQSVKHSFLRACEFVVWMTYHRRNAEKVDCFPQCIGVSSSILFNFRQCVFSFRWYSILSRFCYAMQVPASPAPPGRLNGLVCGNTILQDSWLCTGNLLQLFQIIFLLPYHHLSRVDLQKKTFFFRKKIGDQLLRCRRGRWNIFFSSACIFVLKIFSGKKKQPIEGKNMFKKQKQKNINK